MQQERDFPCRGRLRWRQCGIWQEPETQAIFATRGKILNVEKARLDRALETNEIQGNDYRFGSGIGERL